MSLYSMAGTAYAAVPAVSPDDAHPYWTFARVAQALGTGPALPAPLAGVSTDTRQIRRGDLFVALRGEHFDAHDFLRDAREAGAAAFVVTDAAKAAGLGIPTYVVDDTVVALGQLAHAWRRAWGRTVIAVAGSNGKTSTKDMLKAALSPSFAVHATTGNLNNQIGVPLTLLSIPADAEIAVVEVGTNAPGEVAALRAIAAPDVAVVTSIGEEHLEGLGDLAGVLREESAIFAGVTLAIVPAAHPELLPLARAGAQAVISAGLIDGSSESVPDRAPTEWGLMDDGSVWLVMDGTRITVPLRGAHQAANATLVLATVMACGMSLEAAATGLATMPVPRMRGAWEPLGSAVLLNDAYNANPASMRAALDLLAQVGAGRQRVAILGSMRELGAQRIAQHQAVARAALASPADLIVGIGDFVDAFATEAPDSRVITSAELDGVWPQLAPRLDRHAVILLKASRGVQLERLVPQLTTWATD